jgi:hypothetical protein
MRRIKWNNKEKEEEKNEKLKWKEIRCTERKKKGENEKPYEGRKKECEEGNKIRREEFKIL